MSKKFLFLLLTFFSILTHSQRILVFPFSQHGSNIKTTWLERGLSVAIEENLSNNNIVTISPDDLENYFKELNLVSEPRFSMISKIAIAKEFGATHIITGDYTVENEEIFVYVKIFSLERRATKVKEIETEGSINEIKDLSDKISREIVLLFRENFIKKNHISEEAFEAYIRGRIASDLLLKEVYFRKASELQENYHDANCLLAMVLKEEGNFKEAEKILVNLKNKEYPRKSLGLRLLAEIKMYEGKLSEAKGLILESILVNENAESHILLAKLHLKMGKKEEAIKELKVAESFGTHIKEIENLKKELMK